MWLDGSVTMLRGQRPDDRTGQLIYLLEGGGVSSAVLVRCDWLSGFPVASDTYLTEIPEGAISEGFTPKQCEGLGFISLTPAVLNRQCVETCIFTV